ncbi:MAG: hypothetical protein ACJ793_05135 [Gemmatimonadaceae bacterium]
MQILRFIGLVGIPLHLACGIPGIRPEGRDQSLSATAPVSVGIVFDRAKQWYARNRYVLSAEVPDQRLRGYSTIGREGNVETRAVVEFSIKRSSAAETAYQIESHTEVGVPPTMRQAESNSTEAAQAVSSLQSWLSCPAARWPSCP